MIISKEIVASITDRAPAFAGWALSRFPDYTLKELTKGYILAMTLLEEYIASGRSLTEDALLGISRTVGVDDEADEDNVFVVVDYVLRCCQTYSAKSAEATL